MIAVEALDGIFRSTRGLIAESIKGLDSKTTLRYRCILKDLSLERLFNILETAYKKRKGVRSRNLSNNMAEIDSGASGSTATFATLDTAITFLPSAG